MYSHPPIVPLTDDMTAQMHNLWLQSVRATHHFLTEQDISDISGDVQSAFKLVSLFGILQTEDKAPLPCTQGKTLAAFMGISGRSIEMLFVHPHFFRRGYGKALVDYALAEHGVHYVDVNEQNPQAAAFYARMGFVPMGRDAVDTQGRPFPILHLRHISAC